MSYINTEIRNKTPEIETKTPGPKEDYMPDTWFTKFFMDKLPLYLHLFVYAAVCGFCLMLNFLFFHGRLWTVTMALGWFVGIAEHYTLYRLSNEAMFTKKSGLKASFYLHLTAYVSVMILLIWSNLATWNGFFWVPITAFGWGIGLGIHAILAYYGDLKI